MDTGPRLDADEQVAPPRRRRRRPAGWPGHRPGGRRPAPGGCRRHHLADLPPPSPTRADHLSGRQGHRPAQPDGVAVPPGDPVRPSPPLSAGGVARPGACFDQTSQGGEEPDVEPPRCFRAACLALGLALLGVGSAGPQRDASPDGVRGGTLQVLTADTNINLDTAALLQRRDRTRLRPDPVRLQPLRATRAGDRPGPRHRRRPTPALGRPPHLHLHPAPRGPLRPPVDREVTARDFISAIERFYDKTSPVLAGRGSRISSPAPAGSVPGRPAASRA